MYICMCRFAQVGIANGLALEHNLMCHNIAPSDDDPIKAQYAGLYTSIESIREWIKVLRYI